MKNSINQYARKVIILSILFFLSLNSYSQGNHPWQNPLRMAWSIDGVNFQNNIVFQDSSGVPSVIKWKGDTLVCVFQWFRQPMNSVTWDKVAVKFSYDAGKTWTNPAPIKVHGLPNNYQRPFDPTLAVINKDSLRIYFSSSNGMPQNGLDSLINTYSASGTDGINYYFEPNPRFSHPTKPAIDPAVILYKGNWHYLAPAGAPQDGAYHCVSQDGINFIRENNYLSDNQHNWTGNFTIENSNELRFYGSGNTIWYNSSSDGYAWTNYVNTNLIGGDPSVVKLSNNSYLAIYVGQPYNSQSEFKCGDMLFDVRDGKKYATVLIGSDCWMKQNLNFGKMVKSNASTTLHSDMFNNGIAEKYAMNNDSNNLKIYGGLYEWNELMNYTGINIQGLCPNGWHVSTDEEWKSLIQNAGGKFIDNSAGTGGNTLKETGIGHGSGIGTNTVGFSAKFSGDRDGFGIFHRLNLRSIFWTSTPANQNQAFHYTLWAENDTIQRLKLGSNTGFACRCVKNKVISEITKPIDSSTEAEIYPNPAKDYITVICKDFLTISIFDIQGNQVMTKHLTDENNTIFINELPGGMYIIKLSGKNKVTMRKLIKE